MHEFLLRYMEVSKITLATSTQSYIRHSFCERTLRQRGQDIEADIATCYWLDGSGSNSCVRNIFSLLHTIPDRSWGPPSLICNGKRGFLPRVKRQGCGVDHPTLTSIEDWTIHTHTHTDTHTNIYRVFHDLWTLLQEVIS